MVIGRNDELDALHAFALQVSAAKADRFPASLVLEGEAGIGKTTLLREGVTRVVEQGCQLVSATPSEPDAELAFATLGDLIGPLMPDFRDWLPAPQRHALSVALLEEESTKPTDPRAVSAGVLTVLRLATAELPLLLAIDDAQWIDPATDRALAFAWRRIGDARLGMLLARRVDPDPGSELEIERAFRGSTSSRVSIGPLDPDGIASVIEAALGSPPARRETIEIHRLSGGNPFYAVELARAAMRGDERPTGLSLPVPRALREDVVRGRFAELTPTTTEVLLVASAASRPTTKLVRTAFPSTDIDRSLEEAERASLISLVRGEIRFAHPLLRSAVYADASRAHRHRIHATIAQVVDDPEERGRHLALSADDPDEAIAQQIEEAAASAVARGAPGTAADLLAHAIRLTPSGDPVSLSRRLLAAGENRFLAGDASAGTADASRAVDLAAPGPDRAHALAQLGEMEMLSYRDMEARAHLQAALDEPGVGDETRCGVYADLFWTAFHLGDADAATTHADQGLELARSITALAPRARAYAAAAHARLLRDGGLADDLIEEAPELWGVLDDLPMRDWPLITLAAETVAVGELDRGRDLVDELIAIAEERGDDLSRVELLDRRAEVLLQTGGWPEGLEAARACRELEAQLYGTASESARIAWFEGALGDIERARAEAERSLEHTRDPAWTKRTAGVALGMVELSLGRPSEATSHLEPLAAKRPGLGRGDPGIGWSFLPDLIESLVATRRVDDAEEHVRWLEERGSTLDRPYALATGARGRAQLLAARGDLDGALEVLEQALKEHERLPMPYELARTLLVSGSIRRRAGRKRLAREALDRAGTIFDELGAAQWRRRADAELGHITGRRPAAGKLTDAEHRVARLAAAGFRNREIAEQLFMSVRTVEGHLSDVYGKLGIRSRTELAVFLDTDQDPEAPEPTPA